MSQRKEKQFRRMERRLCGLETEMEEVWEALGYLMSVQKTQAEREERTRRRQREAGQRRRTVRLLRVRLALILAAVLLATALVLKYI